MKGLKGTNQYKVKPKYKFWWSVLILTLFCAIVAIVGHYMTSHTLIKPVSADYKPSKIITVKEVYAKEGSIFDIYVDEAARKFGKGKDNYSKLKSTLHCLLYYESKHGYALGKGDNGKAEGLLQFWESTWIGMRKQMIKLGLAKDISTRYDHKEVIMTTAWAISNGKGNNWGPILRKDCK